MVSSQESLQTKRFKNSRQTFFRIVFRKSQASPMFPSVHPILSHVASFSFLSAQRNVSLQTLWCRKRFSPFFLACIKTLRNIFSVFSLWSFFFANLRQWLSFFMMYKNRPKSCFSVNSSSWLGEASLVCNLFSIKNAFAAKEMPKKLAR